MSLCSIHVLPAGATRWSRAPLTDGAAPFAPMTDIRAAFDIDSVDEAYVLTDTTYHVFRPSDLRWLRSGNRDVLFGAAAGRTLLGASSVPTAHAERFGGTPGVEGITLFGEGELFLYDYEIATSTFTFQEARSCCGPAWDGPLAPSSTSAVQAMWLDVTNSEGWANGDPGAICGASATTVGPYQGLLSPEGVHLLEAGSCFEFHIRRPFTSFAPFTLAGAPATGTVAAAFWHAGLFTFTAR